MLLAIKLVHTAFWALFAGCILAIPIAGWLARFDWAMGLTALVLVECAVLLANGWTCPFTRLAERYTDDRRDNFDILLPAWLARHNKRIFGTLFVAGELLVIWLWLARMS